MGVIDFWRTRAADPLDCHLGNPAVSAAGVPGRRDKLRIDDAFKRGYRLCAVHKNSVDEESGGAGDPRLHTLIQIAVDLSPVLAVIQTGVELFGIQAQRTGVL